MTTLDSMVDSDLQEMIEAVVAAHDCGDDRAFWTELGHLGLADLTGDERRGGSGASWREGAHLARTLARHGCALGVAESDLVAGWLLDQAGLPAPGALRSVRVINDSTPIAPAAPPSPVERVIVARRLDTGWRVADLAAADLPALGRGHDAEWHPVADETVARARLHLALVRCVQIVGTLEAITDLTVQYAGERNQFGRPIGRQQAVQRLVATVAGETALARAATDAAVLATADPDAPPNRIAPMVAVASSCTGHAVDPVIRRAHQVLGAIGTTREHRLHIFTSAALALRSEQGGTRQWDTAVLDHAVHARPLSDLTL
jgi:alkylation response protein AidB-like acyl-CoA dehydrogenase